MDLYCKTRHFYHLPRPLQTPFQYSEIVGQCFSNHLWVRKSSCRGDVKPRAGEPVCVNTSLRTLKSTVFHVFPKHLHVPRACVFLCRRSACACGVRMQLALSEIYGFAGVGHPDCEHLATIDHLFVCFLFGQVPLLLIILPHACARFSPLYHRPPPPPHQHLHHFHCSTPLPCDKSHSYSSSVKLLLCGNFWIPLSLIIFESGWKMFEDKV